MHGPAPQRMRGDAGDTRTCACRPPGEDGVTAFMALSAKLQMRQTQSLAMTPQLLQSIRLLQYSHHELRAFVDTEMERNPLLSDMAEGAASRSVAGGDAGMALSGDRRRRRRGGPRWRTACAGTLRDRRSGRRRRPDGRPRFRQLQQRRRQLRRRGSRRALGLAARPRARRGDRRAASRAGPQDRRGAGRAPRRERLHARRSADGRRRSRRRGRTSSSRSWSACGPRRCRRASSPRTSPTASPSS